MVAAGALPKIGSNLFASGRSETVRELDSVGNGGRGRTTSRAVSRADGLDAVTEDWDVTESGGGFGRGMGSKVMDGDESFAKKYKDMVKPKELVSEEASALESVEKSKMFVHSVAEDFDTYLNTIPSVDPMLEVDERLRKMSMEPSPQQPQQAQVNLDASQQLTPREATPLQLIITDGATGLGASSQALATFATNDLLSSDSVADKPGSPPSGTGAATTGESPFVQTVMTQMYPTLSKQTSFLTSLVLQVQPELHAPAELLHYIEHDLGFPLDLYCPASWPNMFTLPSHMVAATVGIPKHNAPNGSLNPQSKSSSSSTTKVVKQLRRPSFIYRRSISIAPSSSTSASLATRRGSQRAGSVAVGNRSRKASRANSILMRSRRGTATSPTSHSQDKNHSNPPSQPGSQPGSQQSSRPGSGGGSGSQAASRHSQSQSRASSSRVVSATSSAILAKLAAASAEANGHGAPLVPTVAVAADGGSEHDAKDAPARHGLLRSSATTVVSILSPDSISTSAATTATAGRRDGAGRMHAAARRNFPIIHYPPIRVKVQKRKARRVDDLCMTLVLDCSVLSIC
ncbi:hypothetical protein BCR44DRAFT_224738 [Catenaria anguillulae PL171]|uniref:Uncharacterized protein n=1 Tax=Catenaria anguillulae PL171 TaxID=765915 RepID=A0A1Y2HEZ3_9FUNG|nr:hypothetical protein BCR44DRAFT_224738 [Catenaria anguillulae PL171]